MNMNILITGAPGCGKTTLFKRLAKEMGHFQPVGFYTQEIREEGVRRGFALTSLDGQKGLLAHVDLPTDFRVGRYGVDVAGFEAFIRRIPFSGKAAELLMIDEIGKMECLSARFIKTISDVLNSEKPLIATIAQKGSGLIAELKKRSDVQLFTLTREKQDDLFKEICSVLSVLE